ncbi:N-acetyl-gamma-glutamyl-phosphate reductase [Alkalitalea saponilacus]|uniref:N-acetyl-gamma-glutamyl-phosphate reductase n=1 Tax=Alkalitalea saponilacus TaxID=889453 RepID=A0A1T5AMJ4_9BACT|nr:N-acetyl-gamma-glutamyl-phosphate reductase [Alkalitalea saponilacus]ASB48654.1 N-acetyl-gamma-glutamyl-phosphate reductase [Alkalitalea saponilacus]SKB36095.1 N-acetyl-gamma-glutamyl-phosphate reductase [Alkalitalea saponilacus]
MIKVGIIGGAGYTAGELIRILLGHPQAEISWVLSSSHAGQPVYKVHTDLLGDTNLAFDEKPDFSSIDVLYFCMGHGKSAEFIENNEIPSKVKIIDLSHDFRLNAAGNDFVYGLPELNRDEIRKAQKVANPGCFATAIQLALLPLASEGLLKETHIHAITGSTGAGQAPTGTTHFSWRNSNISVYKAFSHQHLGEIRQSIKQLMPVFNLPLNFVPLRGDFTRGILASVYLDCDLDQSSAAELFDRFYADAAFTIRSNQNIDLKQVVNTNKCLLHLAKYDGKLHITSIIDNLTKGASGQAVQNMNLMFGLDEKCGLYLKPSGF